MEELGIPRGMTPAKKRKRTKVGNRDLEVVDNKNDETNNNGMDNVSEDIDKPGTDLGGSEERSMSE